MSAQNGRGACLRTTLHPGEEYLLAFAAVRLDTAILDFLSRQSLSLPMSYFTRRRAGDIQRRLDGARQVRQFAVGNWIGALLALVPLAGALILMMLYSPPLMLAFLATTPPYARLMYFSLKVLRPLFVRLVCAGIALGAGYLDDARRR